MLKKRGEEKKVSNKALSRLPANQGGGAIGEVLPEQLAMKKNGMDGMVGASVSAENANVDASVSEGIIRDV